MPVLTKESFSSKIKDGAIGILFYCDFATKWIETSEFWQSHASGITKEGIKGASFKNHVPIIALLPVCAIIVTFWSFS